MLFQLPKTYWKIQSKLEIAKNTDSTRALIESSDEVVLDLAHQLLETVERVRLCKGCPLVVNVRRKHEVDRPNDFVHSLQNFILFKFIFKIILNFTWTYLTPGLSFEYMKRILSTTCQ